MGEEAAQVHGGSKGTGEDVPRAVHSITTNDTYFVTLPGLAWNAEETQAKHRLKIRTFFISLCHRSLWFLESSRIYGPQPIAACGSLSKL